MIGERIRLAREACGLTQDELAEAAGVTQAALSQVEAGHISEPSTDSVAAVSLATGFPLSFFRDLEPLPDMPEGNHRRLGSLASKAAKQVRAQTQHILALVQRAEKSFELPTVKIGTVSDLRDLDAIESVAHTAREWLRVGRTEPIGNVIRAAERSGVVVARLPLEVSGHDGFSVWPGCETGGRPIAALTGGHSGDRDRFSIAHEVGHLVLHQTRRRVDPKQEEKEAHRFAGALLLPLDAALEVLRQPVTLSVLKRVKAAYGISMAAAAQRAFDLGIIDRQQLSSIHKQLSARRWKTDEPVYVPLEQPLLLPQIVDALAGKGPVTARAERVGMPVFAFNALASSAQ